MLQLNDSGWLVVPKQQSPPEFITIIELCRNEVMPLYPEEQLGLTFLTEIMTNKISNLKVINYIIKMNRILNNGSMFEDKNVQFVTIRPTFVDSVFPLKLIFKTEYEALKYKNFVKNIRSWFINPFHKESIEKLYLKNLIYYLENFLNK